MSPFLNILPSIWILVSFSAILAAQPSVEILRPLHESVVRRQSVEIEVAIHSLRVPAEGFGRLTIDGLPFSDVTQPHVSFIVADERVMAEGVHTLHVALFRTDGQPTGVTTTSVFQFARNFQASAFNKTEVFVEFPMEGQLLPYNVDLLARYSIANLLPAGSTVVITMDGELVSEELALPAEDSGTKHLTAPLTNLEEGQHLLEVSLYDHSGDLVSDCRVLFELAAWLFDHSSPLPSQAPSALAGDAELADVAFGMLVSAGPRTLARTLNSYKQAGLLEKLGQLMVFVQERDTELWDIAERFTSDVFGFHGKIGKGNAWLYMAAACRTSALALIEEDFVLVEPPKWSVEFLTDAYAMLNPHAGVPRAQEAVEVVRLRHRKKPGEPLWVERSFLGTGGAVDPSHLLHYLHFANHVNLRFPASLSLCPSSRGNVFYCAQPKHADYTNNPAIYRTRWLLEVLGGHLGRDNYNTMERRVAPWWVQQRFLVAQGGGLFEHDRVDGQRAGQAGSEVTGLQDDADVDALLASMEGGEGVEALQGKVAMLVWGPAEGEMLQTVREVVDACKQQPEKRITVDVIAVVVSGEDDGGWGRVVEEGGGVRWTAVELDGWDWGNSASDALFRWAVEVDVLHTWEGRGGGGPGAQWVTRLVEEAAGAGAHVVVSSMAARREQSSAEEEMAQTALLMAALVCAHAPGGAQCEREAVGEEEGEGMGGAVRMCCKAEDMWGLVSEVALTRSLTRVRLSATE